MVATKNVSNCINSDARIKNVEGFKDYVDAYCGKYNCFMCDGCSMKNKLNGIFYDKKTGQKAKQFSLFDIDE